MMTGLLNEREFSRKTFLKGGGALIVGFSLAGMVGRASAADSPFASNGPFDQSRVDTWIVIHGDNTASIFSGQAEIGQGSLTGMLQIAAEELSMDLGQLKFVSPDTNLTPQTASQTASTAIRTVGPGLRAAAAYAAQTLLGLAATNLGVPVSSLSVSKGVVSGGGRSVKYGDLLGGKLFNTTFKATTQEPGLRSLFGLDPGQAPAKPVSQYTVVGTRMPRIDIPDKVLGTYTYVHNVKVPGMLHGRIVRPRGQAAYGADPAIVSLDPSSISHIGGARVVQKGNFLGVVAPREYDAIQAAAQLKVRWADTPAVSPVGNLFESWRAQDSAGQAVASRAVHQATDYDFNINPDQVDAALASAAHVVSATYKYHYNGHLPIGPNCCVADVTPNGAIIYNNTQATYTTRTRVANVLGMPPNMVRVKYYEGSSVYGYSGYDEAAEAAAVMSQLAGAPVRLQYMRWDEHGWDFYGPPQMMDIRGGVDAKGNIAGIDYTAFTFGNTASDLVTAQVTNTPIAAPTPGSVEHWGVIGSMYNLPAQRVTVKNVPALNKQFRTSFLRAPLGPQTNFGYEQLIDELAYAARMDPYQFRAQNVATATNPLFPWYYRERWLGVLNAAAQAANWQPRVAASSLSKENVVTGRGISSSPHSWTPATAISEIEVNKKTGKIVVKKLYMAMDAGLSVNPAFVENQIVGGAVQAVSKTLYEQVNFDNRRVTGLDWVTYPILRFKDSPQVVPIVVQRTDKVPGGVGETPIPPVGASIANALFDATGVRLREAPMTPARVRGALRAAGVA
jgi:CO/xanthine dehydrogenase Mo-binding subunit